MGNLHTGFSPAPSTTLCLPLNPPAPHHSSPQACRLSSLSTSLPSSVFPFFPSKVSLFPFLLSIAILSYSLKIPHFPCRSLFFLLPFSTFFLVILSPSSTVPSSYLPAPNALLHCLRFSAQEPCSWHLKSFLSSFSEVLPLSIQLRKLREQQEQQEIRAKFN